MRSFRVRVGLIASGAVLAGGLAGCSVAGTDFQPGVAATVGDQRVTTDDVDRLTTAACDAFGPQLAKQNTVVPLRSVKTNVAQNLALSSAVRQLGEEYGVKPSAAYLQSVADAAAAGAADLSDDEREAVALVTSTTDLVNDILGQIGAGIAADKAGTAGAAPAATSAEATQLGGEQLTRWLQRNDVVLDPQYGISISDTGTKIEDTSLAFGVSDAAKAGQADQPDPAATMALPATQRCGSYAAGGGQG